MMLATSLIVNLEMKWLISARLTSFEPSPEPETSDSFGHFYVQDVRYVIIAGAYFRLQLKQTSKILRGQFSNFFY